MGEPGQRVSGRDRLDRYPHGLPEGLLGAGAQPAQNAQPAQAAAAQPDQPPSDKALQQFLTWRQKGGDASQ